MKINQQLKKFVLENLTDGKVNIDDDSSLFRDKILDSLSLVSLITYLEKTFSFKISPSEISMENLDSINKISSFVSKKKS